MEKPSPTCVPLCPSSFRPLGRWLLAGISVVSLVVAAAFAAQWYLADQQRLDYEGRSQTLQTELSLLRGQFQQLSASTTEAISNEPVGRLFMNVNDLSPTPTDAILPGWNISPTEQTFRYVDHKRGLAISFPYDPDWGNQAFAITPYESEPWSTDTISFGRPLWGCGPDCQYYREAVILFEPVKTVPKTEQAARDWAKSMGNDIASLTTRTFGKIKVVTAVFLMEEGPRYLVRYEVVGVKNNYVIYANSEQDQDPLKDMITSIELIK